MSNIPQIQFDTIKEFKKYCKINRISPVIQYTAKKHQNRKCEYLHEVFGTFVINDMTWNFVINEMTAFVEKRNPTETGYKLGTLK